MCTLVWIVWLWDMDIQGGRQAQNNRIWNDGAKKDVERTQDKCFDFGRTATQKISDWSAKPEIEIFLDTLHERVAWPTLSWMDVSKAREPWSTQETLDRRN